MIDRITNLLVIFIVLSCLAVFCEKFVSAWRHTELWEQTWSPKPGDLPPVRAFLLEPNGWKKLVDAIHAAENKPEYIDTKRLREILMQHYVPTGNVTVRLSAAELSDVAAPLFAMLLLLLPAALNYVRHGKPGLWN